jgi:hypothetical protein
LTGIPKNIYIYLCRLFLWSIAPHVSIFYSFICNLFDDDYIALNVWIIVNSGLKNVESGHVLIYSVDYICWEGLKGKKRQT